MEILGIFKNIFCSNLKFSYSILVSHLFLIWIFPSVLPLWKGIVFYITEGNDLEKKHRNLFMNKFSDVGVRKK